jgi:hypothetical protein
MHECRPPLFRIQRRAEESDMGELLDRLNAMDSRPRAPGEPIRSVADQAALAFRLASQRVNEAIEAVREPGMPLDTLSRWTRQAPLQALAAAFLLGVIMSRRR